MRISIILLVFLLLGCGCAKKTIIDADPSKLQQLQDMVTLYETLYNQQTDSNGFVDTYACDSLIETGISNPNANLTAAEVSSGRWWRRPTIYPECYDAHESASDVSRDGLIGVIFWAQGSGNLDVLQRMWSYGTTHSWIMGQKGKEHSVMAPYHVALLAQAIYHLGGGDYAIRRTLLPDTTPGDGYRGHLQALQNMIKWKAGISQLGDTAFIQKLYKSNDINPLYAYLAGDVKTAVDLLLAYPTNRLPNTTDWCADWTTMQAKGANGWSPCPDQNRTHSGGDFLMVARLIFE